MYTYHEAYQLGSLVDRLSLDKLKADNATAASIEGETAGDGDDGQNGGEGDSGQNTAKNILWEDMCVRSSVLHVIVQHVNVL